MYGAAYPGVGVKTDALVGTYIKSATVSSNTLTLVVQDTTSASHRSVTFTPVFDATLGNDGVLSDASFDLTTQALTLTLSDNTEFDVPLGGFTTVAEVSAAITTATANYITLSDVSDWGRGWQTRALIPDGKIPADIARDSELDGVVTGGSFTGTTLTLNRSQGLAPVNVSGISGGGGAGSADGVVSGGTVSGTTLTLNRTESLTNVTITGLPDTTDADIDARIATYARISPTARSTMHRYPVT